MTSSMPQFDKITCIIFRLQNKNKLTETYLLLELLPKPNSFAAELLKFYSEPLLPPPISTNTFSFSTNRTECAFKMIMCTVLGTVCLTSQLQCYCLGEMFRQANMNSKNLEISLKTERRRLSDSQECQCLLGRFPVGCNLCP